MSISGDGLTSEDDSDEEKTAAADELEGEWMSDSDSGEEEGMYVISFVLCGSLLPQTQEIIDPIVGAIELPK